MAQRRWSRPTPIVAKIRTGVRHGARGYAPIRACPASQSGARRLGRTANFTRTRTGGRRAARTARRHLRSRTRVAARRAFEIIIEDAPGIWLYEPPRSPASTSGSTPPTCAPTSTGRGWPTGGSPLRNARRGIGSASGRHRKPVRRFVAGRLAQAAIVVLLVTTVTFTLVHLAPGDLIMTALDRPGVTEAVRQHWRESFGLDRPLGEQYLRWLGNAARGELGWSFSYRRPVRDVIADALPRTLLLVGLAIVLSFALNHRRGVQTEAWDAAIAGSGESCFSCTRCRTSGCRSSSC